MELYFLPDLKEGQSAVLSPEEARHCVRVLRHKNGDTIQLIDGKGGLYTGVIRNADQKNCVVEIIYRNDNFPGPDFSVYMAVAPTKNIDRFEWFCEKATEVGVKRITPLLCTRSERKSVNTNRIERVMISAIKQSIKTWLPQIDEPVLFEQFITGDFEETEKYICSSTSDPGDTFVKHYSKGKNAIILIGPEGDFTKEELLLAEQNNFIAVNLGPSRLRTETAALIACHTINLLNTLN